jgi:hypothetical protein
LCRAAVRLGARRGYEDWPSQKHDPSCYIHFHFCSSTPCQGWAATQKGFECVWGELVERLHDDIGGQMLPVAAYSNAVHTGAACCFHSGNGVFHDDGPGWLSAQARGRDQVHLRIGLAVLHVLG